MAVIKPTLSITGNANGASTDPGPLSVAIALSATDSLEVDIVESRILTFSDATSHLTIFDGSTYDVGSAVAGVNGGFMYFKNASASDLDVFIGIVADDGSASDLGGNNETDRLFTLRQGEFAFLPFDYTMDITADAAAGGILEYWLFNRSNT